jgi:hypothetical protein
MDMWMMLTRMKQIENEKRRMEEPPESQNYYSDIYEKGVKTL